MSVHLILGYVVHRLVIIINRLKSIMLLNSSIVLKIIPTFSKLFPHSQNYSHILTIIPTKSSPF